MIEQVPRTRCDRPGCNAVVTENGGRFALCPGLDDIWPVPQDGAPFNGEAFSEMWDPRAMSVDLCRACAESLRTWWSSKEARAATKAVGK